MNIDPSYIIAQLNQAKDPKGGVRDAFPLIGNHDFAIIKIGMKDIKAFGPTVFVDLHCLKSDNPTMVVGGKYQVIFRVSMNSPRGFERDEEYARLKFCMNAATGHPASDAARAAATAQAFLAPSNPARGILIKCRGYKAGKSDFVGYDWTHVQGQSPEQIKSVREKLDAKYPDVVQQAAANVAPQPTTSAPVDAGGIDLSSIGL